MSSPSDSPRLIAGKLPGALLERLVEAYRTQPDPDVIVAPGYGRDAAAIDTGGDRPLIVKSDPITFATSSAARYLVAVNANDIACLGGVPRWLTVVMLLPVGASEGEVETLFADLQRTCDAAGISVIGGHTEITPSVNQLVIIGTMLGLAGPSGLLEPGKANPGDDLMLTKFAGIEGTALLAREFTDRLAASLGQEAVSRAAKLLQLPGISIVADANAVLAAGGVTALHDPTEGGVATAVNELARASNCGAEVLADAIPVLPETHAICGHFGLNPLGLLSSGALLVAVAPGLRESIRNAAAAAGIPITHIGRLTAPHDGVTMLTANGRVPLPIFDSDEVTRVL